jgi:ketosteroid isomerase-like protein
MYRFLLAIWIATGIPGAAFAQATAHTPEEEVIAAIHGRLDATARNDVEAWSHFVADDMLGPLEGDTHSKQAWIRTHESWPREVKYWYGPLQDIKVRVHGDTAVVAYHSLQLTTIDEQTTSVHKWQIETLVRQQGRWLLLAVADGLIPPEPVAATIDSAVLDDYVGEYQWAPTLISKIERQGDRLLERFAGADAGELLPENATTFFAKGEAATGDSSRIIFVRDASGRVTHYIYREMGATDRLVKKIK